MVLVLQEILPADCAHSFPLILESAFLLCICIFLATALAAQPLGHQRAESPLTYVDTKPFYRLVQNGAGLYNSSNFM